MTDFTLYTVDLDTQRPNPADNTKVLRGDPPRTAFSKYNDLLLALQGAVPHVGNEAPSPTVPFMKWFDTSVSPPVDRYRNAENTAWLVVPSASQIKELYESNPDTNAFTDSLLDKLANIAEQATKNATDAALRDRATHTGTQAIATVTGLQSALDSKLPSSGGVLSGNLTVPSLNGGQLAGMRNKIINGRLEIGQRGASFAAAGAGTYSLDRWFYGAATSGVITVSREVDGPASAPEFLNSLRVTVTTADTSVGVGSSAHLVQRIEGYNVRDLIGKTFTLSFWVRSSKTGIHCVAFRNSGPGVDRSYITEYMVNVANTWEYKTVIVAGGLTTSGSKWNWTNGVGLQVQFGMMAGASWHTAPDAWQSGDYYTTPSQVNCLDTVGNIFAITGVQLEVGEVATPFEHRPYGVELALCLRYFQAVAIYARMAVYEPGLAVSCFLSFPKMRVTPTVTFRAITYQNCTGVELQTITPSTIAVAAAAVSAGDAYFFSTQDVLLSAEL